MTFLSSISRLSGHVASPADPKFLFDRVDYYFRVDLEEAMQGKHPMKGRIPAADSIKMRTNDYLCIAGDRRIIEAEVEALRRQGHGDSVSRVWLHHQRDALHGFEARVARLTRAEAAVLCSSGYCANLGLIQAFAGEKTPVYIDMKAHASLWEGVRSAGAQAVPFRHNDANHLSRLAEKHGPGLVVVDALYSIDGDISPLEDMIEVTERRGCAIVVDETHSFGAQGPDGAGLTVARGLADRVHFRTIGLSKAVASRGGIVVCSQRNAEYFRYRALPNIFSTSVLAHEVAGYNAALDIFRSDPWRRTRLHANHARLKAALDRLGYNVDSSQAQIIAIEAGEPLATLRLRDALEARGVFGAFFFPPATPEKRCAIRFTVNCGLSAAELDRVISVCAEIREEVGLSEWASTRRRKRHAVTDAPREVRAA